MINIQIMRSKIRQNLERKIEEKRKLKEVQSSHSKQMSSSGAFSIKAQDYIKDWMEKLDLETEELHQVNYNLNIDDTEQQKEIQQTRLKIHQIQKEIDSLKYEVLSITKQTQIANLMREEQRKRHQERLTDAMDCHKSQMEKLQSNFQQKIDKYLKQIQQLLEEKAQFNKECQTYIQQSNKMNKHLKDLQERYKKDIKNAKQAQLVLQKERITKWEQQKIKAIKEEAIINLNPKLQAIIHENKEEIKKTSIEMQKKVQDYKIQYTRQKNEQLQQLKEKSFQEIEDEKEKLRNEERRKVKQNHEQLQLQFQQDRKKLRQMYKDQIMELEKKRMEEIDEFLNVNKNSHEQHLSEVKKMRDGYEEKIRNMKKNITETVAEEVAKVQKKYQKQTKSEIIKIQEQNQIKYKNAQNKINEELSKKKHKIQEQISKQKYSFDKDIHSKYEERINALLSEQQHEKRQLKTKIQGLEEKLIAEERYLQSQQSKINQYQKDSTHAQRKKDDIQKTIRQKQYLIEQLQRQKSKKKEEIEKQTNQIEKQKKGICAQIDRQLGARNKEKQKKEKEWLKRFSASDEQHQKQLVSLKQTINAAIEAEYGSCQAIKQQIKEIEQDNQKLQLQLQKQMKNIKG